MLKRSAIAVAVAAFLAASVWTADVVADHQWAVAVEDLEPLYSLPPHEYPEVNPVTATLLPGEKLRVLRVRYGKDVEAIKVETSRGRTGWVVGGGGVRVVSRGWQNGA